MATTQPCMTPGLLDRNGPVRQLAGVGTQLVVLVTASRSWTGSRAMGVGAAYAWVAGEYGLITHGEAGHRMDWSLITIRHGAARGGDTHLARVAGAWGMTLDPHPVTKQDWEAPCGTGCEPGHRKVRRDGSTYCPGAAARRNQRMVGLGADVCVGFPMGAGWSGTRHCMTIAGRAGIRVVDWARDGAALLTASQYSYVR